MLQSYGFVEWILKTSALDSPLESFLFSDVKILQNFEKIVSVRSSFLI